MRVQHTIQVVRERFMDYGSRYSIVQFLTNLGTEFNSKHLVLIKFYGIKHMRTTVAHPQLNSVLESFHHGLK